MASVLVVDDEEDIRELVGIYIKNEGYQVYKAANGKDALDIISLGKSYRVFRGFLNRNIKNDSV